MKTLILILIGFGIVFFFVPVFPPLNQNCPMVIIEGQEPCAFHKETGYEYFITNKGTVAELVYSYKYDKARDNEREQQEQEIN